MAENKEDEKEAGVLNWDAEDKVVAVGGRGTDWGPAEHVILTFASGRVQMVGNPKAGVPKKTTMMREGEVVGQVFSTPGEKGLGLGVEFILAPTKIRFAITGTPDDKWRRPNWTGFEGSCFRGLKPFNGRVEAMFNFEHFDDPVKTIGGRANDCLECIEVTFRSGRKEYIGNPNAGGAVVPTEMKDDEYVTEIVSYACENDDKKFLGSGALFKISSGREFLIKGKTLSDARTKTIFKGRVLTHINPGPGTIKPSFYGVSGISGQVMEDGVSKLNFHRSDGSVVSIGTDQGEKIKEFKLEAGEDIVKVTSHSVSRIKQALGARMRLALDYTFETSKNRKWTMKGKAVDKIVFDKTEVWAGNALVDVTKGPGNAFLCHFLRNSELTIE